MKFHPSQGCDQPILSASPHDSWETSYRLHQVSCILQSGNSFMTTHHSHFKHQPWHNLLLPTPMRYVSVTVVWMMTHRQLSFSEWWGLMVYVSAVGSAASVWAGRVIITFITGAGWNRTRIDSGLGHTHTHWQVFVKLRQGSGKDGQGIALKAKGLKA